MEINREQKSHKENEQKRYQVLAKISQTDKPLFRQTKEK